MAVRTTIHLDDALLARVRRFIPPRGLNRFINDALAEKLDALEREQVEQAMKEGYLATQRDRSGIDADWHVVDTEGWPA
jgi:Arc/MetJ family transcription regulator